MNGLTGLLRATVAAGMMSLAVPLTPAAAQEVETDTLNISIGPDLPFLVHIVAE